MLYSNFKAKFQKDLTNFSYIDELKNFLVEMFDYNPLFNHKEYVESLLLYAGQCAFWYSEEDKCYTFSYCNRVGNINTEGLGKDLFCVTSNGHSKTFKDFENSESVDYGKVVLIYNNSVHTEDYNIYRFSDLLTELYVSMKSTIINARYNKIYKSSNDIERKAFEDAVENSRNGIPQTFVSSNFFEEESGNIIDLNDVNKVDKLQYLANFHNFLYRDFYNKYGMYSQGSEKIAQQTKEEINEGSTLTFIEVLNRLNARKEGFDSIKEKFGFDIPIVLSECWRKEFDKIFKEKGVVKNDNDTII